MKIFIISNKTQNDDFNKFLSKGIGIPKEKIDELYNGTIVINKHYFNNFYQSYLKEYGDIEEIIHQLEELDIELMDKLSDKYKISIYVYNVLN